MNNIIKVFKYPILEEFELNSTSLEPHKEHRRFRVFYAKGVKCINCDYTATKLILCARHGNKSVKSTSWELTDDDYFPLTIDHIVPVSKGGSSDLSNLQPMCSLCNTKKGNK